MEGFGQKNCLVILKSSYELGTNFFDITQDPEKKVLGCNLKQLLPLYDVIIRTHPRDMVHTYGKNNTKTADSILLRNEARRILKPL